MTIDFICEELAELFDSPCNYSPMDEKMFQDSYCESHCGKVTDKECWKQYFEKVWADRKTEPTISKMEQVDKDINVRSKDEEYINNLPWTEVGNGEQTYDAYFLELMGAVERGEISDAGANQAWYEYINHKDEPQTETEIAKAIVHKMIDDAVIAEDAYPDLRQKMHDAVDEYEPQTDCAWK